MSSDKRKPFSENRTANWIQIIGDAPATAWWHVPSLRTDRPRRYLVCGVLRVLGLWHKERGSVWTCLGTDRDFSRTSVGDIRYARHRKVLFREHIIEKDEFQDITNLDRSTFEHEPRLNTFLFTLCSPALDGDCDYHHRIYQDHRQQPQMDGFLMEHAIKLDDWGVPLFQETSM